MAAVREAAGPGGIGQIRVWFSDRPEDVDVPGTYASLPGLLAVGTNPLHIALLVECPRCPVTDYDWC